MFKNTFPKFKGQLLSDLIPSADEESIQFISKFLNLNRKERINVKDALCDKIFKNL